MDDMAFLPPPASLRLLGPADDIAALTRLLHRAYAPLAAAGMRFVASHQDEATTRRRIADAECWLAEVGGEIVGTICLYPAGGGTQPWYARPEVAKFGQFAVEPALQSRGIGSQLLSHVEQRASQAGAAELACDTAETADPLIAWYTRRGYRFIEYVKWEAVNYRSVVLSKML